MINFFDYVKLQIAFEEQPNLFEHGSWQSHRELIKSFILDGYNQPYLIEKFGKLLNDTYADPSYWLEQYKLPELPLNKRNSIYDVLNMTRENKFEKILPFYGLCQNDLYEMAVKFVSLFSSVNRAPPVENIIHLINFLPGEDTFFVNEIKYSYFLLNAWLEYVQARRHIDFNLIDNIIEIGAGLGRSIEIIKLMHPHISIYSIDIPELIFLQSYILERYNDKTKKIKEDGYAISLKSGEIAFFTPNLINLISPIGRSLFKSSWCLGTLEPNYAKFLLEFFADICSDIHLVEPRLPPRVEITKNNFYDDRLGFYKNILASSFGLIDQSICWFPTRKRSEFGGIYSMFFRK